MTRTPDDDLIYRSEPRDPDDWLREPEDEPSELLPELKYAWDMRVAGELSDAEDAMLVVEASRSELDRQALQVMRPLSNAFVASLVDRVSEVAEREQRAAPAASWALSRRWGVASGLALAAAALVGVWLGLPPAEPDVSYLATWRSGFVDMRSVEATTTGEPPRFGVGAAVRLDLVPVATPRTEPEVRMAINDWSSAFPAKLVITPHGVARLQGVVGEPPWDVGVGSHRLFLSINDREPTFVLPFVVEP